MSDDDDDGKEKTKAAGTDVREGKRRLAEMTMPAGYSVYLCFYGEADCGKFSSYFFQ